MTPQLIRLAASAAVPALMLLASAGPARADTMINIDATTSGCDFNHCNGNHLPAGAVVDAVFSPTQLTLGPGTYTITNGSGLPGSNPNFSAWRFDSGPQWVWSFMIIDDATRTILMQGCCGSAVFSNQAAAASQPFAQNFSADLTLGATTKLDFVTEDYFPQDNAGGMSLNVAGAVPEPSTWALMGSGLLAMGFIGRRRARGW